MIDVSVIIPTYNGKHKLNAILRSLEIQSFKSFETIVIIDGSTDGTKAYLESFETNLDIKIIEQVNGGRAKVRNNGAKEASGKLLIFFDDDIRLESGCVEAHINHHYHLSNSILTGAQRDDPTKAKTDFQSYKCFLSKTWVQKLKKKDGVPLKFSELYLSAANFSISKELFELLGGFDEKLRDCEDYDLALRANFKGVKIYYSEKAFAWHDDFPSPQSFIYRQLEYKQFHNFLFQNNAVRYAHLLNSRLQKPKLLKRLFFSVFKSTQWLKIIEQNQLTFLPQSIRYKLYSWIITAHSTYKEYL